MKYFVFDVESAGLNGDGFAVGYAVVDGDTCSTIASDWRSSGIESVACGSSDMIWLGDNLPREVMYPENRMSHEGLKDWFEGELGKFPDALLVSDCAIPVESNWLRACGINPYPLIDVSTALLMAGRDPVGTYERLPYELPKHHPMHDARQSARVLLECLSAVGITKNQPVTT